MWRSHGSKDRGKATRAHHRRSSRFWPRESEERNDQGNDINDQSRSLWGDHHQSSHTWGTRQHHRFQMGSRQRRRSQVLHRRTWLLREHQGWRRHLCINTFVCNPASLPGHRFGHELDDQSWRHQHCFSSCCCGISNRHLTTTTEGVLSPGNILWRLKKAIYGLRSSPKAWQDHLANILQELGSADSSLNRTCSNIPKDYASSWSMWTIFSL